MNKFLEMFTLSRLNEKKNRKYEEKSISNEIESIILKNSQQTKVQDLTGEFYQTSKEEITPILLKLFQNCSRINTSKLIL